MRLREEQAAAAGMGAGYLALRLIAAKLDEPSHDPQRR